MKHKKKLQLAHISMNVTDFKINHENSVGVFIPDIEPIPLYPSSESALYVNLHLYQERLIRFVFIFLIISVLVGAVLIMREIFINKNATDFIAIVIAYGLALFGALSAIYTFMAPIISWIWFGDSGRLSFGRESDEVAVLTILFSILMIAISCMMFLHEHLYAVQINALLKLVP